MIQPYWLMDIEGLAIETLSLGVSFPDVNHISYLQIPDYYFLGVLKEYYCNILF